MEDRNDRAVKILKESLKVGSYGEITFKIIDGKVNRIVKTESIVLEITN